MSYRDTMPKEDVLALELPAVYESFSYRKYSMAKFEEYSFYSDHRKFLPDAGIIAFNNSDGRLMALKPDITLSIVKNAKLTEQGCARLYYNDTVYRMREDTHDYREIRQIGAEALGQVDAYTQAELCYLALCSLAKIDPDFILSVSHMGLAVHYADTLPLSHGLKKQLIRFVASKSLHEIRSLCEGQRLDPEITERLCGFSALRGTLAEVLPALTGLCVDQTMREAAKELAALERELSGTPYADRICFDASVINHIDYYNGLIFQGSVRRCPFPVLSGGRYDLLAGRIRARAQAIGFAVYLDGLNLYYPTVTEGDADVFILCGEDTAGLLEQVRALTDAGKTVRVGKDPNGVRAGQILRYEEGKLC